MTKSEINKWDDGISLIHHSSRAHRKPKSDPALEELLTSSTTAIQQSTAALREEFGLDEDSGSWTLEENSNDITFTLANGDKLACKCVRVGTWSEADSIFMWAWDHQRIKGHQATGAKKVLKYGQEHDHEILSSNPLRLGLKYVIGLSSVAAHINKMPMTYKIRATETTWLYLAMSKPKRLGAK